eukprot:CAMPEP_0194582282 /NCGR_PEP_ID=MMETSP0292-20121207/15472_1 /TAXON_ID=39354 /ORGANISM="Heterosigma akashiwo, Strain CCMP2393" /LENGTH=163 /DNA_ID=CAMNT_0039436325 /DNA_START=31 /DNA_END=519 /DNA_ORIENTATION=-
MAAQWAQFRRVLFNKEVVDAAWNLVKFGSAVYCCNEYLFEITVCVGPSMLPTLSKSGDVVLQEKLTPRFGKLEIGDVVILTSPTDTAKNVCKRITGLAGDTMVVRPTKRYMREKIVDVPPGHAYLEGDNPMNSTDSRNYGPVPLALITGRVFMKIWPVWDAGW